MLRQLCNDCRDSVLIETMESLQNGVATHFEATTLFLIRPVLLVSSQHCHSIDTDAQCKRALTMQVILAHRQIRIIWTQGLFTLAFSRTRTWTNGLYGFI